MSQSILCRIGAGDFPVSSMLEVGSRTFAIFLSLTWRHGVFAAHSDREGVILSSVEHGAINDLF